LSAILTTFAQGTSPRMMSWCSEVHSLWSDLSLSSFTGSLKSRRSSTMTGVLPSTPDDWPTEMVDATWIPVKPYDAINTFTINACCRYTDDCMHRRLVRTIKKQGGEFALTGDDLNDADEAGQTVLHLAARWGASWELLEFLITRVDDISAINCRGETFMHVLQPTQLSNFWPRFHPLLQAISARDFRLDTLDCNGQTFFTRLVDQLDRSDHSLVEKYYILEKLLEREEQLLLVLLPISEAGGRVASNFVRIFTALEASLRAKRMHTQAGGARHHILRLQAYAASLPTPPGSPPAESTPSLTSGGSSPASSVGAYSFGTYASSTGSSRIGLTPPIPDPAPAPGEVNRYDATGRTPLMHAVAGAVEGGDAASGSVHSSSVRRIETLLRAGADPRLQDRKGNTALHQAVLAGQAGVVRALLRGGADPNTRNLEGRSAARMAEEVYRDGGRAGKWKKGIGAYAQRFSTLAVLWNHAAKKEKGGKS
jgi:ankyrin repeat protein